jgi:hypothetical protein
MWDGTSIQLATGDPTRDLGDTGWSNIFDPSNPENSCLMSSDSDIAEDTHDSTEATPAEISIWDEKWFNFKGEASISAGPLETDPELGSIKVTEEVPVSEGGGFYATQGVGSNGEISSSIGAYVGIKGELDATMETDLNQPAPNLEFGMRAGPGSLSVGVDAAPLIDIGARWQENVENNLYDFYSNPFN